MLGIISLNVNLREFFNRHVRKLETGLLDLGLRLGLSGATPAPKRCTPVRLRCTVCRQERWHTIQPTVVGTHQYGPAVVYMCTRCKSKSVTELFPEVAGEPRSSSPVLSLPEDVAVPSPDSTLRRLPQSGPSPAASCPSKEEVKDQLFKLLQASDAWMDALEQTTTSS